MSTALPRISESGNRSERAIASIPTTRQLAPDRHVICQSRLGLRPRLRSLDCAPRRHWVSLAEQCNGPTVTVWPRRSSVPDRTPCAAPRIDHQLGTGAELPPSRHSLRGSDRVPCAEFLGELPETLGTALRHQHGHPAQSERPRGSEGRTVPAHQRAAAEEIQHQSPRRSNLTETASRLCQCAANRRHCQGGDQIEVLGVGRGAGRRPSASGNARQPCCG
jgi:hypothetical protein